LADISLNDGGQKRRFESLVMPHLDAAYNLARWLTRNDSGRLEGWPGFGA
jgi:hypothetical protein